MFNNNGNTCSFGTWWADAIALTTYVHLFAIKVGNIACFLNMSPTECYVVYCIGIQSLNLCDRCVDETEQLATDDCQHDRNIMSFMSKGWFYLICLQCGIVVSSLLEKALIWCHLKSETSLAFFR